jgi:hemerythrin-like domain-containing protein
MMPIGPLMIEHRLIERMIDLVGKESTRIAREGEVDPVFIDTAVDFIRTYADRAHHGKEEDILFRELAGKDLSEEHQQTMDELVHEHVMARQTTGELVEAKERYLQGDEDALETVVETLDALAAMYPSHIRKEDQDFFIPVMAYFSEAEQDVMLDEMWEFDRDMIHERYEDMVEELEAVTEDGALRE